MGNEGDDTHSLAAMAQKRIDLVDATMRRAHDFRRALAKRYRIRYSPFRFPQKHPLGAERMIAIIPIHGRPLV
jgi:hypothetical protein